MYGFLRILLPAQIASWTWIGAYGARSDAVDDLRDVPETVGCAGVLIGAGGGATPARPAVPVPVAPYPRSGSRRPELAAARGKRSRRAGKRQHGKGGNDQS